VLDLCCGTAGPGALLVAETACGYLGVDRSADSIGIARERTAGLPCRFAVAAVPPLPPGRFDVVLLLETILAFAEKKPLVDAISEALAAGGRFAFTLEEGAPLTPSERAQMPNANTVWPVPLESMLELLDRAGLTVTWQADWTAAHGATAAALAGAYAAGADAIAAEIGRRRLDDLVTAHELWADWLAGGRIRKLGIVAVRS